jgi:hypothetical protein
MEQQDASHLCMPGCSSSTLLVAGFLALQPAGQLQHQETADRLRSSRAAMQRSARDSALLPTTADSQPMQQRHTQQTSSTLRKEQWRRQRLP